MLELCRVIAISYADVVESKNGKNKSKNCVLLFLTANFLSKRYFTHVVPKFFTGNSKVNLHVEY